MESGVGIIDGFSNADHVRVKDRGHGVFDVPRIFQIFEEFFKDEPLSTHLIVPEPIALRIPKKD